MGRVITMSFPRQRGANPADARSLFYSQYGSSWTLTGSLLASTLLYMGLYLLVAAISAVVSLATGLDQVLAGVGSLLLLPYIVLIFLLGAAMARSVGHVGRELALGALMMVIIGPLVGLLVGYGLAVAPAAVGSALLAVGGSLVVTAAIAVISPWDLSRLGGLAFVALIGLIVTQGLALFLAPVMGLVASPTWAFIGILVFELYLVVDLSRIRRAMPYGPNDGLAAYLGLNLAMDVINLFMYFLQLFLGGARRR